MGINLKSVMPVVEEKVVDLAKTPPGAEADSKAKAFIDFLIAVLSAPEVAALFPASWKGYVAAALATLVIASGSALVGRWTAPATPPAEKSPVTVNVHPPGAPDPITPPIQLPASANKILVYRTTETPQAETDKLPVGSVDPKRYAVGSSYSWQGKSIPLPCVALVGPNGVIDVQPFTTAEAAMVLLKGK